MTVPTAHRFVEVAARVVKFPYSALPTRPSVPEPPVDIEAPPPPEPPHAVRRPARSHAEKRIILTVVLTKKSWDSPSVIASQLLNGHDG